MPQQVAGDLRVWRAAQGGPDHDLRPAGAPATDAAATRWQQHLQRELTDTRMPDITPWWPQLKQLSPHLANDPQLPRLALQIEGYAGMGLDANHMLDAALHGGLLPVQGIAAALTYRLARHEYPRGWPPALGITPATDHTKRPTATNTIATAASASRTKPERNRHGHLSPNRPPNGFHYNRRPSPTASA